MTTSQFEVVDFIPNMRRQDKKEFIEMLEIMLKVPPGKSIRKCFSTVNEAKSFYSGSRAFIKRKQMTGTLFVRCFTKAGDDGKFYVYIGRKQGE